MKLRNKKTGEIREFHEIFLTKLVKETNTAKSEYVERSYPTIVELINADWEDYTPAEPLIKDEKIRKAVRAWAEANSLKLAAYSADGKFYNKTIDCEIAFKTYTNRTDIPECKLLPIAELCGEED
jgi:hypothetical protein